MALPEQGMRARASDMELPTGWELRSIGSLADKIKAGGTPSRSSPSYWGGDTPFAKIEDITRSGGFLSNTSEFITAEGLLNSSAWLVPKGSVLLTMYGTIGVPAVSEVPLTTNQAILAIVPSGNVDREFLLYALWKWGPAMVRLNVQSTQKNIGAGIVKSFALPVPPFEEQRAIAHVLRTVQRAKEQTEQVLAAAQTMRVSAFIDLFGASYLGGECPRIPLGRAATWLSGGTPRTSEPSYWDGDVPWITSSSLTTFRLHDSARRLTQQGVEAGSRLVPADSTICVVRGMSLRKEFRVGIASREMAFGQDCKALLPNAEFDPLFFAYAVKAQSREVLDRVDRAGHGTGRLSTDALKAVTIPVPSKITQERVARTLSSIDAKTQAEEQRREALDQLFKTLLHELMTGQKRVGDQVQVT